VSVASGGVVFETPTGYSNIFLYKPSDKMLGEFKRKHNYTTELVYAPARLWKLKDIDIP
jgi:hypothetical protein